jgi:hypothetical protein
MFWMRFSVLIHFGRINMRLKFNDGSQRELPFNARLGARLIFLAQKRDNPDYRLELDLRLPLTEQEKQLSDIQREIDRLRLAERCGEKI